MLVVTLVYDVNYITNQYFVLIISSDFIKRVRLKVEIMLPIDYFEA